MPHEVAPQDRRAQAEALFVALNARDFDALADMSFDPEMEFHSVIAAAEGRVYYGVDGLREWGRDLDSIFDDVNVEMVEFREVNDERALLSTRVTARAKGSGVPVNTLIHQVWTWRKGLLWRNDAYTDPLKALEAAGLRK